MLLPWIYSYVEDSIKTLMDGIQQKINKPPHQSSYSDRKAHHFDLKTHHSIKKVHQEEKSFNSSFNRLRMKNRRLFTVPIGNPNFSAISLYLNPATNI